jgi:hypothetical protein
VLNKYLHRKYIICIALLLVIAELSHAAEFIASVLRNSVSAGESIELRLILKDAEANGPPDLTVLTKDFSIYSQQQYSTYSNTNGKITSETGWEITILPDHKVNVVIPSIKINTNKGTLATQEIKLSVNKAAANDPKTNNDATPKENIGVSLVAAINKTRVYVKEPIIYTLKIISYRALANVALDDIKSSDAIIDKVGQPLQYEQTLGGVRAHIIELKYHITPLVAGKIEITPASIRGEVQVPPQQQPQQNHRFGMLNQFFFDNGMNFKPFSLQGDKISITALAPAVTDKNWLPLQNLEIYEEWSGLNGAKVGDTIVRKVKITATGGFANQLPSVKDSMDIQGLKLYADKPVLTDNATQNNQVVVGTKEEMFSLVPSQAGTITFPAIKISWWNLRTKKAEISTLAGKTITILPALINSTADNMVDYSDPAASSIINVNEQNEKAIVKHNLGLYAVMASMLLIIMMLFGCVVYLLKRKDRLAKPHAADVNVHVAKDHTEIEIKTVYDLREHILIYAFKYWQAPNNITINNLGHFLSAHNYKYTEDVYLKLCKEINSVMYANLNIEITVLFADWKKFKSSVLKSKNQKPPEHIADYINLNPT